MTARSVFHKISYLAYPFLVVTLYYYVYFFISLVKNDIDWGNLNNVLVFMGIAISLSTLQDTTTTQNKFSQKVWESPKKGKAFLIMLTVSTIICMASGLIGYLASVTSVHEEISVGLIVLGIGLVGMLKAAIEMFENHRLDKQTNPLKS